MLEMYEIEQRKSTKNVLYLGTLTIIPIESFVNNSLNKASPPLVVLLHTHLIKEDGRRHNFFQIGYT